MGGVAKPGKHEKNKTESAQDDKKKKSDGIE